MHIERILESDWQLFSTIIHLIPKERSRGPSLLHWGSKHLLRKAPVKGEPSTVARIQPRTCNHIINFSGF